MLLSAAAAALVATAVAASATIVRVGPGELHLCAAAARHAAAEADARRSGSGSAPSNEATRCVLAPGTYRESIEYHGSAPLEIVGAGVGVTQMRGDVPLGGLTWTLTPLHNGSIYSAPLPPGPLRTPGVQQAFIDDEWISEARYPNTDLKKVLKLTSWGDCGKGSSHGYCKDRPDAWSNLGKHSANWTVMIEQSLQFQRGKR